ncbi:MAG: ATP-dependent RecD-like DNA helicase [Myxococcota bacterium]|nr:ATP-dependent RecD-like DNA helicase [Myxococcota bacterium]
MSARAGPLFQNQDANQTETLRGEVRRVVFANAASGFAVVRMITGGEEVTVVGVLAGLDPGMNIECQGRWVEDKNYGRQFRADAVQPLSHQSLEGVRRFLSANVDGVGDKNAERLVAAFGMDTLDIIINEPSRLTGVEGISDRKAKIIHESLMEQQGVLRVMTFLMSHGATPGLAHRIYSRYREQTVNKIREDPYVLAFDVFGVGFKTADRIARSMGIDEKHPRRIRAFMHFQLETAGDEGHVYLPVSVWIERGIQELQVEPGLIEAAVESLRRESHVVIEKIRGEEAAYARSLHRAETGACAELLKLRGAERIQGDLDAAINSYAEDAHIELTTLQREALREALTHPITVITGGPGTGKTTIMRGIVRILKHNKTDIALAAPTGRAARRLAESAGHEAMTIHRLLEYNTGDSPGLFGRNAGSPLSCGALIVDEASMIDIQLLYALLSALPANARVVFVGDVDQLPSVGAGNVLRDLIASGAASVVRLREIFRQARSSDIVVNAHRVNSGEPPVSAPPGGESDFFIVPRNSPEEAVPAILQMVRERIPKRFGLDPVEDVQVLVPMHRGAVGAENLNRVLQAELNPGDPLLKRGEFEFRLGDKVMQIRNDYDREVFNGDVGRIVGWDAPKKEIIVRFGDRESRYHKDDTGNLMLAYAITVHKSQGSEYPAVITPLFTQHYMMLQRNLLYTAITRGKKLVVLIGQEKAIGMAVRNNAVRERYSALADRIRGALRDNRDGEA